MSFDFHVFRMLWVVGCLWMGLPGLGGAAAGPTQAGGKEAANEASKDAGASVPAAPAAEAVTVEDPLSSEQKEIADAAIAKPVSAELVQVYGWRENVVIQGVPGQLTAKLDTGARTSSIHAENKELFERDGKKWVRFVVTDPTVKGGPRTRIEAPLVRVALIKEPGGESMAREVVKLGFKIGDRAFKAEFTLNNRSNMLAPVLIGRTLIRDLGMVDVRRAYIADQKIFR